MKLVLATRESPLARWQAEAARRLLSAAWPDLEVELLFVRSAGDRDQTEELARFGRIGIFTAEVDRAVLDGRAHAAVHSLKDMTTTLQEGMRLGGVLPRGSIEDAWVTRSGPAGRKLAEVEPGARVATDSRRRAAMLRAVRPDLEVVGIRGNVETRLEKLRAGAAEALILACAGLERLGLEGAITERLDTRRFLPAVGQGLIGLTCRAGDDDTSRKLHSISDLEAFHEGLAERALLAELRGGCNVPIGASARVRESTLVLVARVLSLDGRRSVEGEVRGARDHAQQLGILLARDLQARGAGALIEAARA